MGQTGMDRQQLMTSGTTYTTSISSATTASPSPTTLIGCSAHTKTVSVGFRSKRGSDSACRLAARRTRLRGLVQCKAPRGRINQSQNDSSHASFLVTANIFSPISKHILRNLPRLVLPALVCDAIPATLDVRSESKLDRRYGKPLVIPPRNDAEARNVV